MDYQTFANKSEADKAISTMRGWDARAVRLLLPESTHADEDGYAYVIQCDETLYLRDDGFVR